MESINPANSELISQYSPISSTDLKKIINQTHSAVTVWKETSLSYKRKILQSLITVLMKNVDFH